MKTRRLRFLSSLAALSPFAAACGERAAAPSVEAPPPEPVAVLVASGATPRPGGVVTFSARLSGSAAPRKAGAYTARVMYDSNVVTYAGEGEATSGIAAFNAARGVLTVAGASLEGYADGILFNAKFRVARSAGDAEFTLVIDELRDVNAADRLPPRPASRSALLRPWK